MPCSPIRGVPLHDPDRETTPDYNGLSGKKGTAEGGVPMLVKDELLDKVVARIREQMPEDQAPQVEEFARQYYGWVDAADLEDRSPIDAYGAALSHWNFAGRREPGEWKITGLQPPLRGARLAVDPYRRRDGERRHALPGRLGEDGDKPPGLRHTHDPPPRHERAPRRGRPAPRSPPPRHRRGRRHLRVSDPRRGGPPDGAVRARRLEASHREDPRRREGGRGGLARDAREGRGDSLRARGEPARLRA